MLGEALIDLLEQPDGLFAAHLGGSPYNVAIGLGRLNAPVNYLSPISTDKFGQALRHSLIAEGVNVPDTTRSERPTSLAVVVIDDHGQPSYQLYREGVADTDFTFDEAIAGIPATSKVFHTGSLALASKTRPRVERLIRSLRERSVLISVDLNIRIGVCEDTGAYLDGVRGLIPICDLVKGSDEDLAHLYPDMAPEAAARQILATMSEGMVVLTQGAKGAALMTRHLALSQAGEPIQTVVDTVGAGDTFQANFLAQTHEEATRRGGFSRIPRRQLKVALRRAVAAAAINVSRAGCNPPSKDEVDAFLLRAAT